MLIAKYQMASSEKQQMIKSTPRFSSLISLIQSLRHELKHVNEEVCVNAPALIKQETDSIILIMPPLALHRHNRFYLHLMKGK